MRPASESNAMDWDKDHIDWTSTWIKAPFRGQWIYWLTYLADKEELVGELANESGDVGHNGILQEGETPHDGWRSGKQKKSRSK